MKLAAWLLIVALEPAAFESAWAQTTASIVGTVTDAANHRGLSGALVSAENGSRALTAADGSFTLGDLQPGDVHIRVKIAGYRQSESSARVSPGDLLKLDFDLHPMARLSGRIVDRDTGVILSRTVLLTGRKLFQAGGVSFALNHKNAFDIPSLEPGDYTLQIQPDDEAVISYGETSKAKSTVSYGPFTYPETIHLVEGEQRVMQIRIAALQPHSAAGTVEFPSGFDEVPLSIVYSGGGGPTFTHNLGRKRSGPFRIDGLVPGTYRVFVEAGEASGKAYGGVTVSITDHDVEDLRIRLLPAVSVTGNLRVAEDNVPLPSQLSDYTALLMPLDRESGRLIQLPLSNDGKFHAQEVAPGEYWVQVLELPEGYALSDVWFGNVKTENRPIRLNGPADLTLVVTSRPGAIAGVVRDKNQAPVKGHIVSVSPEFGNPGIRRGVASGAGGQFVFRNLAPGKYRIEGGPAVEVRPGETAVAEIVAEPE